MNTLLFAVGIFVFMITVYGTVMAGGATLKRKQTAEFAPDQKLVVNSDGWEVIATKPHRVVDDSSLPTH
jgi:hypothetical protein